MATSAEIKSNNNTLIRVKTTAKSITKANVADQLDASIDYTVQEIATVNSSVVAKVVKRTLTHSELLNLAATPIVLLPAVVEKLYMPTRIILKFNDNSGWSSGGGNFTVKLKNGVSSDTLSSFASDLGSSTIKEQMRFISFSTLTATDSFFNRMVEFSITTSPTIPIVNTTTISVYLVYNEITL